MVFFGFQPPPAAGTPKLTQAEAIARRAEELANSAWESPPMLREKKLKELESRTATRCTAVSGVASLAEDEGGPDVCKLLARKIAPALAKCDCEAEVEVLALASVLPSQGFAALHRMQLSKDGPSVKLGRKETWRQVADRVVAAGAKARFESDGPPEPFDGAWTDPAPSKGAAEPPAAMEPAGPDPKAK